ncbi:MAG: PQQ-binding-like beta-propeller repeat protein [Candidatus Hydrogenedentes bacterium]|nr:PQQ-binding-like beta-propeller repeat protein [Candidatus Hydrogenedentota bacterium]
MRNWFLKVRSTFPSILATLLASYLFSGAAPAAAAGAQPNWPEFRGPTGDGHAAKPNDATPIGLPLQWSETENVKWKTPIPLQGWSTPAVLGGQVWMTTATPDGHEFYVICVDAETGHIRFNEKLFHCDNPEDLGNNVNCYASPSPVVEPGRVYVHFGSYGTACLDTVTCKVIWKRSDLPCRHYRGPGSSPIVFGDLLILTFDGADLQYLAALDKKSGKTVWKTDRATVWNDLDEAGKPKREGDFRKAFTTPLMIEAAGTAQLISPGSSSAYSYDPWTGQQIWMTRMTGYTPATCPVFGNGLVFITSGRGKSELMALRVDGHGDVTDTHLAWKADGPVVPQEPSPIWVDDLLYLVTNNGTVTCFEAKTGNQVWSERIGGNYLSSPVYADGRLYFQSTQGKSTVLRPGRTYEVLATNTLEASFMASPVVVGKSLFLRSKTHLYRIEETAPAPKS